MPRLPFLFNASAANKARDTLSSRLFSWSHTQSMLPAIKRRLSSPAIKRRLSSSDTPSLRRVIAQLQSGEIVFLRRGFLSFCGRKSVASAKRKSAKHGNILQGIMTAWSPRHSFRLRCASCGAGVPLRVTLAKCDFASLYYTLFCTWLYSVEQKNRKSLSICYSQNMAKTQLKDSSLLCEIENEIGDREERG